MCVVLVLIITLIRRCGQQRSLYERLVFAVNRRQNNASADDVSLPMHFHQENIAGDADLDAARQSAVTRNTSVRSVMTLPTYSVKPKATETTISREGDRSGIDTVVEFPETAEEEESRRDQEMESLYQIRAARRREREQREQQRREQQQAREQGDQARLEALRLQSRLREESLNDPSSGDVSTATMLAEHRSRSRNRRVSSVSYASIGQVQHDGSRIRNSQDSDRAGLLDGAAAIELTDHRRNRTASGSSSFFSAVQPRGRSGSSLSISTAASDDVEASGATHQRSPTPGTEINGAGDPSVLLPQPFPDVFDNSQPPSYDQLWAGKSVSRSGAGHLSEQTDAHSEPTGAQETTRRDAGRSESPNEVSSLPQLRSPPRIRVEVAAESNTSPIPHDENLGNSSYPSPET